MRFRRFLIILAGGVLGLILAPLSWAGIVSGTIESISADRKKVVVKPGGDKPKQTFSVPDSVTITVNGKPATLKDLSDGQQISVFTSTSDTVTKLVVRAASSAPKSTPSPSISKPAKTKKDAPSESPNDDVATGNSADSPQFRGPARDGHASSTRLQKSWPPSGPKPLWSASGLGEGYAAVSVANGRVFTMGLVGNDEKVLAVDEKTGRPLWASSTGGEPFRDGAGNGPRCTPTVDGDRVYAQGCFGDLVCLDAKSGQRRWHKNVLKEFDGRSIHWGICESPLIDGEKIICTPGGRDATMVALNKQTGALIWKARVPDSPPAGYASAIAIEVGGVRQYVNFTAQGVIGVRAADGEFLWSNRSAANGTANCSAPTFFENHVFYASGYGTGGALVKLESNGNTTRAEERYKINDMKNHHGGMVVVDGFLYGCDENILTCLDLLSGKVMWKDRNPGKGSITFADGLLIVRSENGPVTLVDANSKAYVEKGRFEQPRRSNQQSWAYPVVANGKLLLRDLDLLLCYDLRGR